MFNNPQNDYELWQQSPFKLYESAGWQTVYQTSAYKVKRWSPIRGTPNGQAQTLPFSAVNHLYSRVVFGKLKQLSKPFRFTCLFE